jgi:hypothetical protein
MKSGLLVEIQILLSSLRSFSIVTFSLKTSKSSFFFAMIPFLQYNS